jgi:hypothetical protein
VGDLARKVLRQLGEPGVVSDEHDALVLAAEVFDHLEQLTRRGGVQPLASSFQRGCAKRAFAWSGTPTTLHMTRPTRSG